MLKTIFKKTITMLITTFMLLNAAVFSVSAEDGKAVMSVKVVYDSEEIYKEFDNFEDGWVFIHDSSNEKYNTFDVKLYADWIAPDGKFYYTNDAGKEVGTNNGRLYLDHRYEGNSFNYNVINIDLNGYKIDRNLKEPTKDGQVFFIESGSVRIFDSSKEQTGMITGANNSGNGGAFYVDNGTFNTNKSGLFIEGGTITGNYATNGGAVYWNSDGLLVLTGGVISGNHATNYGGGLYINDWGTTYIGGTPKIKENYVAGTKASNMYLADTGIVLRRTGGQETNFSIHTIPDLPLREGAEIGINSPGKDVKFTNEKSRFAIDDYTYLHSDDADYYIRALYNEVDGKPVYDICYTGLASSNYRDPRVTDVSIKDHYRVKSSSYNVVTMDLKLTVANNMRASFEMISLERLISTKLNYEKFYVANIGNLVNLIEGHKYRIMADNNSYAVLTVSVEPFNGEWAQEQEPYETVFGAIVYGECDSVGYDDPMDAWTYAVGQSGPVTMKLFKEWVAPDGTFYSSRGTYGGSLYLYAGKDVTLDLNGNTISRGLSSPTYDGHVFLIKEGAKLTITDSSESGNGRITGGYANGNGGAFYVDDGKLYINGGHIVENKASGDGGAIYGTNEDDTFIYINGGKIADNVATGNGGGIFMYNGYLYVDGGEISDNKAEYGGGIYWDSRDKLCLTGGSIKNNVATEGGGVYVTDWGDIYLGGTIWIRNNSMSGTTFYSNLYISDTDAYINNAAGQSEVPNKPLTDGAYVGISANGENYCMSDSDSRFTMNSVNYIYTDVSPYIIRSVYNADGGNHTYKLYYNHYHNSGITIPGVKTIENKCSYVNNLYFSHDFQNVRLVVDYKHKNDGTLNNIALSELASVSFDHDGTEIIDFNEKRDFTKEQEFMVLGSDGTYDVLFVYVEWVCPQHNDADGNYICDYCEKYILSDVTLAEYNAETKEATVFVTKAGRYSLIFADYEGTRLANVDVVEYDFKEGINVVSQEVKTFALSSGDKVMLWYDIADIVPECEVFTVK